MASTSQQPTEGMMQMMQQLVGAVQEIGARVEQIEYKQAMPSDGDYSVV